MAHSHDLLDKYPLLLFGTVELQTERLNDEQERQTAEGPNQMTGPVATLSLRQQSFPSLCPITAAVAELAAAGIEARGAVYTRLEVVEFLLDLVGYAPTKPLHQLKLLEPSFGAGDFLLPAIERLVASWSAAKTGGDPVEELAHCICAVELHEVSFHATKLKVVQILEQYGVPSTKAARLAGQWLINGDFLLVPLSGAFNVVIGNPPYVRQELIPDVLIAEYRARYATVYDRADLYIPFIERSLLSLGQSGQLGFICADRWMKNRYGGPLRALVAKHFHLKIYVDMFDTPAFHSDVIAYPAITIIGRDEPGPTRIARRPTIERAALKTLSLELLGKKKLSSAVRQVEHVPYGDQPWILDSADQLSLVRRLENSFPTIEAAGCKVGIGVATGADKVFIGPFAELDVEPDRKLPLAMTRDILTGHVQWRGLGVLNPFADDGGLVDLRNYPKLEQYLRKYKLEIGQRHVAQKAPSNWYRTIDRIYPELARRPKLLIPDIKGEAQVVYEDGKLYPHHNLYYVISDTWNLRALQAVLMSGIARLFVSIYSTKMRGGYLRFQAQYLRRIRIPQWEAVPQKIREQLIQAAEEMDQEACNRAVVKLFGLSSEEATALEGAGG